MKILITAPSLDETENVSGISTLVREIIRHRGKIEFAHFPAGRKDSEKAGIRWILRQIILPFRFFRQIRREKPDIVHINTALVPLSIMRDAALTFAAKIAAVPVLLHPNGGRFLIENFDNRFLEFAAARMLRVASKVLVLSEYEKRNLTRRWENLDISILPNAISIDKNAPKKSTAREKTIVFFGRIHESKGLQEIVEVCEILKKNDYQFRFNCFGTGPQKEFFVTEMTRILGDKFYYGGVASGDEKWSALAESDVFLLPSRYGEGLPLAMLEAMTAGCCCVVSNVASVGAVIRNGVNGFIIEPRDVLQLTATMKRILSGEIDTETIGSNARKTVEDEFNSREYIKKLERIYAEVMSKNV